jgi:hypothetical protein
MRIRNYLGTRFEIWNGGHSWFWFVGNACCSGAAIGAAANEAEAISEACRSIEEIAARSSTAEVAPGNRVTGIHENSQSCAANSTAPGVVMNWRQV